MSDADSLFPGALGECYDAFVEAIEAEGGAEEQFAKTQVSFGLDRKFAWLVPLTRTKCLVVLDMYEEHDSPLWRTIIRYRDDKYTHQAEVRDAAAVRQLAEQGWFRLAREWGAKER